jgi:predicted GIY-YIG superfamily endonuclease
MVKEYELYVLRLEQGRYYVGQTGRLKRRIEQHVAGNGALWTKLYPPIERIKTYVLPMADIKEVERLEDELTIDTMARYGWRNVRGGHFCNVDDHDTEMALRAHGRFDRVLQAAHRLSNERAARLSTWMEAIHDLLQSAERYYDLGFPLDRRNDVVDASMALKQFSEWRDDLSPALDVAFWDRKGLLPVLLTFQRNRVTGCRLQDPFAVLAAARQRGRGGRHPWNRLLLVTWQVCRPPISMGQQEKLNQWLRDMIEQPLTAFDTRYDAFVSIAFPKTRHWLRQADLRPLLYDVHDA